MILQTIPDVLYNCTHMHIHLLVTPQTTPLTTRLSHSSNHALFFTSLTTPLFPQFKCCGSLNHLDWEHRTQYVVINNISIAREPRPQSCCRNPAPGCTDVISSQTVYYRVSGDDLLYLLFLNLNLIYLLHYVTF